jgi:hypothetical protein
MKIRIKNNSIRYRLTRSDVADLVASGQLEDSVDFGAEKFVYALTVLKAGELTASFENNTVTLFMSEKMVDELANTDKVGFENNYKELYLLVEKDFTCLDNVAEDQSDNYPNPLAEKTL